MNINCPLLAVGLWRSPRITYSVSKAPFLAPSQLRDEEDSQTEAGYGE